METTKERAARCDRATHARRSSSLPAYGSRTASITRRRRRAKRKALRAATLAATAFLLDGPETLLRHIGLDERDTYTTKHEIDDLVTVVHITREEAPAWQH